MSHRVLTSLAILATVILLALLAPLPAEGQARSSSAATAATWTPSKTPWGDPDLQGIYTSDDVKDIPLERPTEFGERLYFTDAELAQQAAQLARQAKADLQEFVAPNARVTTGPPGNWGERARRPARQTSLIVDPPNGRIPALTPEGQKRQAAVASRQTAFTPHRPPASWEDYDFYIRCITRGLAGSMFSSSYDNGTQIVQAPGYVTLVHEKVHEARVIPLDKRPHVGQNIRTYLGDSRGHWEGNTLVVETTNFLDNRTAIGRNGNGIPTSDVLRLIERFTRIDPNTIQYELTVDDPKIFTKPWKVAFPITQEPGYELFEYTCHETNYAMFNSLSGARAEEKAAADAHHSFAAEFDANKPVQLRGVVTRVEWINPHAWIHIEVKNPDGTVTPWMIEGGTPNTLFRRGITKESLPAGTEIIVDGYRAKNGTTRANGRDLTLADGRTLFMGSTGTGAPGEPPAQK